MTPTVARQRTTTITSLYTPHERAVLSHYLGIRDPRPQDLAGIDPTQPVDPEEWDETIGGIAPMPSDTDYEELMVENAVARICLLAVQGRLPAWACVSEGRVTEARRRHRTRKVARLLASQHLFTINWADSGPGFSWPEAYRVTHLPGYDVHIVTASADSPDAQGYCDRAIGWFRRARTPLKAWRRTITGYWTGQRFDDQERWAYLFDTGAVDEDTVTRWADAVWGREEEDPYRVYPHSPPHGSWQPTTPADAAASRAADLAAAETGEREGDAQAAAGDHAAARTSWRLAAARGSIAAHWKLAVLYCRGASMERDPIEAARRCRSAAHAGDPRAQLRLARASERLLKFADSDLWQKLAEESGGASRALTAAVRRRPDGTPRAQFAAATERLEPRARDGHLGSAVDLVALLASRDRLGEARAWWPTIAPRAHRLRVGDALVLELSGALERLPHTPESDRVA
jgi:hypothetical protein